jgi:hypothetical protein
MFPALPPAFSPGRMRGLLLTQTENIFVFDHISDVDLMEVGGKRQMACMCNIDDPALITSTGMFGVAFGIVNIATHSGHKSFISYTIETARLAGVSVIYGDSNHMSNGCSCCGCIDDCIRAGQTTFSSIA